MAIRYKVFLAVLANFISFSSIFGQLLPNGTLSGSLKAIMFFIKPIAQ
jgi:hypothetical protein